MISDTGGKPGKDYGVSEAKWIKYIELSAASHDADRSKIGKSVGFYNMNIIRDSNKTMSSGGWSHNKWVFKKNGRKEVGEGREGGEGDANLFEGVDRDEKKRGGRW